MFKYILLFLIVFSKLSFADTEKISLDKLKLLMSEGVPLIDIRTAKEWQETGVIKDSHLITFFNENGEVDIYKWLNELELVADKNKPLILICRSGRRTGIVSDYLDKYFEFFKIYDATDGIKEWKKIIHYLKIINHKLFFKNKLHTFPNIVLIFVIEDMEH